MNSVSIRYASYFVANDTLLSTAQESRVISLNLDYKFIRVLKSTEQLNYFHISKQYTRTKQI